MLLDDIPGYREAIAEARAKEAKLRTEAFLPGMPVEVCGIEIEQMTLRHFVWLSYLKSAVLFQDREIKPEDVALFLWVLSPGFDLKNIKARDRFIKKVANVSFEQALEEIDQYIEAVFLDAPGGGKSTEEPVVSPAASVIHRLASVFGWSDDAIMEMSLVRIFQYLRILQIQHNPRTVLFNKLSDRVRTNLLKTIRSGEVKGE